MVLCGQFHLLLFCLQCADIGRAPSPQASPPRQGFNTEGGNGWCGRSLDDGPPQPTHPKGDGGRPPSQTKHWIEGWLSVDRSEWAALLRTTPWPRIRSSTSHLAPRFPWTFSACTGDGGDHVPATPVPSHERHCSPIAWLSLTNRRSAALRYHYV